MKKYDRIIAQDVLNINKPLFSRETLNVMLKNFNIIWARNPFALAKGSSLPLGKEGVRVYLK